MTLQFKTFARVIELYLAQLYSGPLQLDWLQWCLQCAVIIRGGELDGTNEVMELELGMTFGKHVLHWTRETSGPVLDPTAAGKVQQSTTRWLWPRAQVQATHSCANTCRASQHHHQYISWVRLYLGIATIDLDSQSASAIFSLTLLQYPVLLLYRSGPVFPVQ